MLTQSKICVSYLMSYKAMIYSFIRRQHHARVSSWQIQVPHQMISKLTSAPCSPVALSSVWRSQAFPGNNGISWLSLQENSLFKIEIKMVIICGPSKYILYTKLLVTHMKKWNLRYQRTSQNLIQSSPNTKFLQWFCHLPKDKPEQVKQTAADKIIKRKINWITAG